MATEQARTRLGTAGPHSQALNERKAKVVPEGLSSLAPFMIDRSRGAVVTDVDGNDYLDFTGGWGCLVVGHSHPKVVEAIRDQTDRYVHTDFSVVGYEPYIELAERLAPYMPGDSAAKLALFNSGAEAVENAVKVARWLTRRPAVVVFEGGFHGRTLMTMTMTHKATPYKAHFGPFAPDVYRVPFPSPARSDISNEAWKQQLELLVAPDEVAAIVVEPIQGEGGFVVPNEGFLPFLEDYAQEHCMMLVADEVQTGMGRTGTLFASERFQIDPDLIAIGKSLASGLPLSGLLGKGHLMDKVPDGGIGGTYVGNPLGCAAAVAVMEVIEEEGLLERATELGDRMQERFRHLMDKYELLGDIRGLGSMQALELVGDRETKAPAPEATGQVVHAALEEGLMLAKAGLHGNAIRMLIPLALTDDELDDGLDRLERAIARVAA
ncbi:MAG: aspartate aminotransferase family protein [Candidatus Bipolaricaulia bacterium]